MFLLTGHVHFLSMIRPCESGYMLCRNFSIESAVLQPTPLGRMIERQRDPDSQSGELHLLASSLQPIQELRTVPYPIVLQRMRIKVPGDQEEEEQMPKATDDSKARRETAKKEREQRKAEDLMKKAAESSRNRREMGGTSNEPFIWADEEYGQQADRSNTATMHRLTLLHRPLSLHSSSYALRCSIFISTHCSISPCCISSSTASSLR